MELEILSLKQLTEVTWLLARIADTSLITMIRHEHTFTQQVLDNAAMYRAGLRTVS